MTKILLIEDEADLREEVLEILGFEHFEVLGAENGQRGVELASVFHPDLIISDIMMPGLDGFDVLERIRETPELAATPFIF
ncbi:MAG: response regulator, partial [Anaerolineae bacterium]|nr:response regulator [Anaerolineae bacterium]